MAFYKNQNFLQKSSFALASLACMGPASKGGVEEEPNHHTWHFLLFSSKYADPVRGAEIIIFTSTEEF